MFNVPGSMFRSARIHGSAVEEYFPAYQDPCMYFGGGSKLIKKGA